METQLRTAFRVRFSRQEILRFTAEVAFLFAAMVVYFLIRGGLPVRPEEAFDRANQVIRLEDRLGKHQFAIVGHLECKKNLVIPRSGAHWNGIPKAIGCLQVAFTQHAVIKLQSR